MAFGVCNKEDIVLNAQLDGAAKPTPVTVKGRCTCQRRKRDGKPVNDLEIVPWRTVRLCLPSLRINSTTLAPPTPSLVPRLDRA